MLKAKIVVLGFFSLQSTLIKLLRKENHMLAATGSSLPATLSWVSDYKNGWMDKCPIYAPQKVKY